jgi:hypothetical protein
MMGKILSFICMAHHDLVYATCPYILNVPSTKVRTRLGTKFETVHTNIHTMGRVSSVDIVTRYRLGSLGIESQWGARLSTPVQTGPGAYPASYTMGTGPFPGVKWPGRGVDHPPHLTLRLKKE